MKPVPSMSFERVLKRAAQHVQSSRKGEVQTLNILVAMFSERDSFAVYFLEKQNLTRLDLVSYISHEKDKDEYNNEGKESISQESNQETKSQNNLLEKQAQQAEMVRQQFKSLGQSLATDVADGLQGLIRGTSTLNDMLNNVLNK